MKKDTTALLIFKFYLIDDVYTYILKDALNVNK